MERAADGEIELVKTGEIESIELRDEVSDTRAVLNVEGERVKRADTDAEVLSERVATDEALPLTDREIDVVNVFNAVYDSVLRPERDTIEVTVTSFEDDGNDDTDSLEDVDWLTHILEEIVNDVAIEGVTVDVADSDGELVVK